jgi:predicted dehydrogenase
MHPLPPLPAGAPLPVVVYGAGRRGTAHARAALAAGATVLAVCDPDRDRAAALVAETGGRAVTRAADLPLAEAAAALVTTPPALHAEQTLAALAAGCHVVLEKPISLCLREARAIQVAAEAAGRWVHVCQQQRYSRAAEEARSRLEGRKVALAHIWLYRQAPDIRGNWSREWGGGHIVEWAIHPVDWCRYLLGDVESVYAAYGNQVLAGTPGWDNWDAYSCTLRFASGAVGSIATSYACWPDGGGGFGVDVVAENLLLRWRPEGLEAAYPEGSKRYAEREEPTAALYRAFLGAIRTGDPSPLRLTYPDALATLATVLACNRSHETGSPVRVSDLLAETGETTSHQPLPTSH